MEWPPAPAGPRRGVQKPWVRGDVRELHTSVRLGTRGGPLAMRRVHGSVPHGKGRRAARAGAAGAAAGCGAPGVGPAAGARGGAGRARYG